MGLVYRLILVGLPAVLEAVAVPVHLIESGGEVRIWSDDILTQTGGFNYVKGDDEFKTAYHNVRCGLGAAKKYRLACTLYGS